MPTNIKFTDGEIYSGTLVEDATPAQVEDITASGTSAQTTMTANHAGGFCVIETTADVWVKFGSNPTAGAGDVHLVTAGSKDIFRGYAAGDKVAVVTA